MNSLLIPLRGARLAAAIGGILALGLAVALAAGEPAAPPITGEPPADAAVLARTTRLVQVARDGQPPEPRSVTVTAVGDVSLAREVAVRMAAEGAGYPYALVSGLLRGDIVIGNLEGALTTRGEPWPKGYNFRTDPAYAGRLADAGFDLVSLANNHTMDYGADGLLDTVTALASVGVRHAGAGANDDAAYGSVVIEREGLRVAFVAFVATPDEGGGFSIWHWAAGAEPGVAIGTPEAITSVVHSARERADFVVVLLHAGTEFSTVVDATQRILAAAAFEAGATAVIGAHPHVPQAIEWDGTRLVAWSLGNFIFDLDEVDYANIPVPRVTPVLEFTLTEGRGVTAVQVLPAALEVDEDRPRPATTEEAAVLSAYTGLP